jgi:DNA mismatch repair protein MutS
VARLAGLPAEVIQRARRVLEALEVKREQPLTPTGSAPLPSHQLSLFEVVADPQMEELREALLRADLTRMTPLEALNWLATWQERLRGEGESHG